MTVNVENNLSRARYMGVKHLKEPVNPLFQIECEHYEIKKKICYGEEVGDFIPMVTTF